MLAKIFNIEPYPLVVELYRGQRQALQCVKILKMRHRHLSLFVFLRQELVFLRVL